MNSKILWTTITTGLVVLLLNGCATLRSGYEPPRVHLVNIEVEDAKMFETVFKVQLRVFNTNDEPMHIKGGNSILELNGKNFAQGISDADITIPAYGTEVVPMTLYSSVVGLVRSLLSLPRNEKLSYELKGNLRTEGGMMLPSSIPFTSDGELSLEKLLEG